MPMVTSSLGAVVPFTLRDSAQFRASPPPPHLKSGAYTKAYNEAKARALSTTARERRSRATSRISFRTTPFRSSEPDAEGHFRYVPRRHWRQRQAVRAGQYGDGRRDNYRLGQQAVLKFWRPITTIHEGENDGNPQTEADPDWVPFLITPNYPDYTSGSNSLSGAATTTLARFLGTDKVTFSITSAIPQVVQNPRVYARFSEAAADIVNARIYEGIHFRFADEVARRQSTHVANWTFSHFLRPLGH